MIEEASAGHLTVKHFCKPGAGASWPTATSRSETEKPQPDVLSGQASVSAMAEPAGTLRRQVLCVCFVDVVGFSALMHENEERTFHRWTDLRDGMVLPLVEEFGGSVVKSTGDGILVTFADALSGVRWSAELQARARQRRQGLALRVSLNYCPVLPDGGDLLGDGVNIAARLQEHVEGGGVILTGSVQDRIAGRPDIETRPLGNLKVRKLSDTIAAFELITDGRPDTGKSSFGWELPSIAVMPLVNLGGDQEDEYLSTGIVEDIVVSLASQRDLTVISRSSTLAFARQSIDPRAVGEVLGVRYLITGTLRRSGGRIRISTVLLDTGTGQQLASLKRDFAADDLFAVQDEIVESALTHLLPGMHSAERRKAMRKWPGSYNAYDDYLKALDLIGSLERQSFDEARIHLSRAIHSDPGFSTAKAWAARWHSLRVGQGWSDDPRRDADEAAELALHAIHLDEQNALALATYGHVQAYMLGDFEAAIGYLDRARDVNPNSSVAWLLSSVTLSSLGRNKEAIAAAERALRLSPFDQRLFVHYAFLGIVHYDAGDFELAIRWLSRGLTENPRYTSALRTLAVAHVATGQMTAARAAVARLMQHEPGFTLSQHRESHRLYHDPDQAELFLDRLKQAGAPE